MTPQLFKVFIARSCAGGAAVSHDGEAVLRPSGYAGVRVVNDAAKPSAIGTDVQAGDGEPLKRGGAGGNIEGETATSIDRAKEQQPPPF